jgi:hypothetical protein
MKSIITIVVISTLSYASAAQGVFTNDVNSALQRVIQDYPNHFVNLKGAQVKGNRRAVQFHSTVEVPGSLNCVLTECSSSKKDIYSWNCVMLASGNYGKAKDKFNELYNQIRNTIVKMEGEKPFILNGKYESPSDDKNFTSIIFQLLPATGDLQKLKVELTLQHSLYEWKVALAVYDEERRNHEQRDLTDRD